MDAKFWCASQVLFYSVWYLRGLEGLEKGRRFRMTFILFSFSFRAFEGRVDPGMGFLELCLFFFVSGMWSQWNRWNDDIFTQYNIK